MAKKARRKKPVSPAQVPQPKYAPVRLERGQKVGKRVSHKPFEDEAGWNWATMGNKRGPHGIVLRKKRGGKGRRK